MNTIHVFVIVEVHCFHVFVVQTVNTFHECAVLVCVYFVSQYLYAAILTFGRFLFQYISFIQLLFTVIIVDIY